MTRQQVGRVFVIHISCSCTHDPKMYVHSKNICVQSLLHSKVGLKQHKESQRKESLSPPPTDTHGACYFVRRSSSPGLLGITGPLGHFEASRSIGRGADGGGDAEFFDRGVEGERGTAVGRAAVEHPQVTVVGGVVFARLDLRESKSKRGDLGGVDGL